MKDSSFCIGSQMVKIDESSIQPRRFYDVPR